MEIPYIAPSLGGVDSLIEQPALMSYFEKTTEERLELGIKDNLVRFAIGIEDAAARDRGLIRGDVNGAGSLLGLPGPSRPQGHTTRVDTLRVSW